MKLKASSPRDRAHIRARKIDPADVEDAASHAAEEAAYACSLPRDLEEYTRKIMKLQESNAPRNGAAWTAAKQATYLDLTYPVGAIAAWFADAGISDSHAAAARVVPDIAEVCHAFRQERMWEGLHWKRGKTAGLGNQELREHLMETGETAIELGLSLYRLQCEARRPGHAGTPRGASVRALYSRIVDNLIAEIGAAASLDEADAPTMAKLHARIDVDADGYVGGAASFERALLRHGRWCQAVARQPRFWSELPEARMAASPARDRFIKRLAECWERATLTPATCTDASDTSRASGFVIFIACVHGHFAGLAEAKFLREDKADEFLSALGLRRIPTARTIRNILRRVEIRSRHPEE